MPSGYAAFSTLTPSITRPSLVRTAAPTWNFEYGAYARCGDRVRPREELVVGHAQNTWKITSVTSAPSSPPRKTSSSGVDAGLDAGLRHEQRHDEGHASRRGTGSAPSPSNVVTAIQPPNATAACPDGSPPRSGVPRPVYALAAITSDHGEHERDQRHLERRLAQTVEDPQARGRADRLGEDEVADRDRDRPSRSAPRPPRCPSRASPSGRTTSSRRRSRPRSRCSPSRRSARRRSRSAARSARTCSRRSRAPRSARSTASRKWIRMFRCVRRTWMIPSNA